MTHAADDRNSRATADATPSGTPASSSSAEAEGAQTSPVATAARPDGDGEGAGSEGDNPPDASARASRASGPLATLTRAAASVTSGRTWVRHLYLLLIFEVAGVVATWPLFTFLYNGMLPATEDTSGYVWDLWWVGHHVFSPGQIFYSGGIAAPIGIHLGFGTIMPLAGILLAPVTLTAGPATSLILLCVVTPGLLCYSMFRLARLWLNAPGAIAAGAFFGLSSTLAWRDWFHINVALGTVFLPLAIEAAIRLRRTMKVRDGVYLGVVLGASVLINQQSFVIALIIAGLITATWVVRLLIKDVAEMTRRLPALLAAIGAIVLIGGIQFLAMIQQMFAGGASPQAMYLKQSWVQYGVSLPTMFGPSPRLSDHGLAGLTSTYYFSSPLEGLPTYGIVLSVIAVLGIAAGWRNRSALWFAGVWLAGSVLALGTSLVISTQAKACAYNQLIQGQWSGRGCTQYLPLATHLGKIYVYPQGHRPQWSPIVASNLMPYTWLVRLPGLYGLREADRFMFVGLIGAAMLAGLTVQWLVRRKVTRPLIAVVAAVAVLEAGWGGARTPNMPDSITQVAQALAKDHTDTIVVDVPFGLRGGLPPFGERFDPWVLNTATADGHRRAISFTAWVSSRTVVNIDRHAFYYRLLKFQALKGARYNTLTPEQIANIKADFKKMKIGTVVEWIGTTPGWIGAPTGNLTWPHYLSRGHFDYNNVAGFLTVIGMKRTSVICIAGPKTGCPLPDQVWIWKPAS